MKAIHQLKDDRQLNFAEYSAKLLGNLLRENGVADQADIITSVPMHRSKRRKRGYDLDTYPCRTFRTIFFYEKADYIHNFCTKARPIL